MVELPKREARAAAPAAEEDDAPAITKSDLANVESKHIVENAEKLADSILSGAKNSAESIILEAYDKADEIRGNAEKEGYEAGRTAAEAEYESKRSELLAELAAIKSELVLSRERLFSEVEQEVVELALLAVENILGRKIAEDASLVSTLVSKAVAGLTGISRIVVRISGGDAAQAESVQTALRYGVDRIESVEIKIDDMLPRGSCIVETERGIIDSSIDRQLIRLKTDIRQLLGGREAVFEEVSGA